MEFFCCFSCLETEPEIPPPQPQLSEEEARKKKLEEMDRKYKEMQQARIKRQETRAAAMEEKKSAQGLRNDVIEENMQKIAERGENLDEAVVATGRLRDRSAQFRRSTQKLLDQQSRRRK